ncbi:response regulator [Horticoccus luteus]|uniref:Response regulator n=1 Tax=Horticoccus luteus TaxID=2862869 RepID=A0A8F9XMQ9_9BACT|nr:response regulator [Horticoccus luteus]QYM80531.1 response regulator [Horticoccus luteus]
MNARTILYVEDEADDVLFMRFAFQRLALNVDLRAVGDGSQAIAYLAGEGPFSDRRQHPLPAVLLLDLNLPLQSGFEVLQWLRHEAGLTTLPVVIFSSSGRPEDRARAQALGASDYWLKPSSGLAFADIARDVHDRWLQLGTAVNEQSA